MKNRPNPKQASNSEALRWTWPLTVLISLLVLMALVFAVILIVLGVHPVAATVLAVAAVGTIVSCVVPQRSGGWGTIGRRALRALGTLAGADSPTNRGDVDP
ncbi:hypothetical protein [Nocardia ninae]|uniref:hypothetical protein n=1 Tax=Nocardia ninae TaxID=356145 RepID=UPI0011BDAC16|nr:hypothetical protein [Nocardia ninae]